jgi:hypothetical protein
MGRARLTRKTAQIADKLICGTNCQARCHIQIAMLVCAAIQIVRRAREGNMNRKWLIAAGLVFVSVGAAGAFYYTDPGQFNSRGMVVQEVGVAQRGGGSGCGDTRAYCGETVARAQKTRAGGDDGGGCGGNQANCAYEKKTP